MCLFHAHDCRFKLLLFALPIRLLALPKLFCDSSVQFVHVSLIDATADSFKALLKPCTLAGSAVLHLDLLRSESAHDLRKHFIRDVNALENFAELRRNLLFAEARKFTFSPIAAATVIDVFALLEFRRNRAVVMRACQHSPKGDVMLAVLALVVAVHDSLGCIEESGADDRFVFSPVLDSAPLEISEIDAIIEYLVEIATGECFSELRLNFFSQLCEGEFPRSVHFENCAHNFRILGVNFDIAVAAVVPVSKRGVSGVDALFGFFPHPLDDFFSQIIRIEFRGNDLDTVHEFRLRFGVFRKNASGFYEMNFRIELFQRGHVFEISGKPVGLFDQNDALAP